MENYDVNESPLFAAGNPYAGKNSRLERSFRARQQLRDSKGRWVYMGGNLGLKFKLDNGNNIRVYGKNVGPSDAKPGFAQVYIQGQEANGIADGFYLAKADKGRIYKAILSPEQLKAQGIDIKEVSDLDPELQSIADLTPIDAPEGWEKKADGSYGTPDGDYTIEQNADGKWSFSRTRFLLAHTTTQVTHLLTQQTATLKNCSTKMRSLRLLNCVASKTSSTKNSPRPRTHRHWPALSRSSKFLMVASRTSFATSLQMQQ